MYFPPFKGEHKVKYQGFIYLLYKSLKYEASESTIMMSLWQIFIKYEYFPIRINISFKPRILYKSLFKHTGIIFIFKIKDTIVIKTANVRPSNLLLENQKLHNQMW